MLIHKTGIKSRDVKLAPKSIEIYFFDNGAPLALELPSIEELASIRDGYQLKFSFPEIAKNDIFNLKEQYQYEMDRLLDKYKKYEKSSSYLVNLSNLSELLGENGDAYKYLEKAAENDDSR